MTDSIIVYRNPMEAAMWEGLSNGQMIPIAVGLITFFAVFLMANHVLTGGNSYRTPKWKTYGSLGFGVFVGISVARYMWLG